MTGSFGSCPFGKFVQKNCAAAVNRLLLACHLKDAIIHHIMIGREPGTAYIKMQKTPVITCDSSQNKLTIFTQFTHNRRGKDPLDDSLIAIHEDSNGLLFLLREITARSAQSLDAETNAQSLSLGIVLNRRLPLNAERSGLAQFHRGIAQKVVHQEMMAVGVLQEFALFQ